MESNYCHHHTFNDILVFPQLAQWRDGKRFLIGSLVLVHEYSAFQSTCTGGDPKVCGKVLSFRQIKTCSGYIKESLVR